ncbi:HAMP domain-containing histidine kinase [Kribbella sp. NBC_01245]|uniref:sensor histidine kinase n=1 Tax=Kribbella sp. NBC_01245 TaxID=2903578 RepID=UPI002E2D02EC|nr:HAMP domain-containing sensor histidine kinase [Kribbella sp. NBC_01245]
MTNLLNWRSLRWKIAALVAFACCTVALAIGLMVHEATEDRAQAAAAGRARAVFEAAIVEYNAGDKDSLYVGTDRPPDELLAKMQSTRGIVTWYQYRPKRPSMWAGEMRDGKAYSVEVDMTWEMLSVSGLDLDLVKYSVLALAILVPLAALAAELPNGRLRRGARVARRIAAGDLEARTGATGRGDEIDEMCATLDQMADSLRDRLVSEQRFTADVAHELRTPLMGLMTSAELLPEGEATDLVRGRVKVLRGLVEDLLEISRLDAGAEQADPRPVALPELVADALARTGLDATLTITADARVETDPRRLDRIIANLVVNAHRHGRPPVDVVVNGSTIVVRDHGDGFPADLLSDGPQRFRTGVTERGRGHGLGLTIAMGQAAVIGADLTFANAAEGGAVATVRLPDAGLMGVQAVVADLSGQAGDAGRAG